MKTTHITYTIVAILILSYITIPYSTLATGTGINALLYHFAHANILHLTLNTISLILLIRSLHRVAKTTHTLALAYTCATCAALCTTAPTVGASGIIYALLGMHTSAHLSHRLIFRAPKYRYQYIATIILSLLIGYIIPNISATIHTTSYILGLIGAPLVIKRYYPTTTLLATIHFILTSQYPTHHSPQTP